MQVLFRVHSNFATPVVCRNFVVVPSIYKPKATRSPIAAKITMEFCPIGAQDPQGQGPVSTPNQQLSAIGPLAT